MTKKLLSLLLALLLIFTFATPTFAEGEDGIYDTDFKDIYSEYFSDDLTTSTYDFEDDGSYKAANGYNYFYFAALYDSLLEGENNPHKYANVWDFADLLSDSEEKSLQLLADSDKSERGLNVYFLTYDDACGVNETTFTDDFYDYYITKLDFGNEVDGILYAIDMDNRQLYINTAGEYSTKLSTSEAYSLLDKTYEYASNGDYYSFFTKTDSVVLREVFPSVIEKLIPTKESLIVSAVVAAVVVVILLLNHKKGNKAPAGQTYLKNFNVVNRNAVFLGHREEVIHDYYKKESSGGGGHSSGGGGSHGGGGHGF